MITSGPLLEKLVNILKPFEEMTRELTRDVMCASFVIPAVQLIVKSLDSADDRGVKAMKEELATSMKRHFPSLENNKNLSCATLLDPRFKTRFFKDKDTTDNAIAHL